MLNITSLYTDADSTFPRKIYFPGWKIYCISSIFRFNFSTLWNTTICNLLANRKITNFYTQKHGLKHCVSMYYKCYLPMRNLLADAEFLFFHTECEMLNLVNWYSVCYKILLKDKSLFGGQTGDCIFTKKPIKSAKTHFFLEFLAYLHFVAW